MAAILKLKRWKQRILVDLKNMLVANIGFDRTEQGLSNLPEATVESVPSPQTLSHGLRGLLAHREERRRVHEVDRHTRQDHAARLDVNPLVLYAHRDDPEEGVLGYRQRQRCALLVADKRGDDLADLCFFLFSVFSHQYPNFSLRCNFSLFAIRT